MCQFFHLTVLMKRSGEAPLYNFDVIVNDTTFRPYPPSDRPSYVSSNKNYFHSEKILLFCYPRSMAAYFIDIKIIFIHKKLYFSACYPQCMVTSKLLKDYKQNKVSEKFICGSKCMYTNNKNIFSQYQKNCYFRLHIVLFKNYLKLILIPTLMLQPQP